MIILLPQDNYHIFFQKIKKIQIWAILLLGKNLRSGRTGPYPYCTVIYQTTPQRHAFYSQPRAARNLSPACWNRQFGLPPRHHVGPDHLETLNARHIHLKFAWSSNPNKTPPLPSSNSYKKATW